MKQVILLCIMLGLVCSITGFYAVGIVHSLVPVANSVGCLFLAAIIAVSDTGGPDAKA